MFNIFDPLVEGFVAVCDAIILPFLIRFGIAFGEGNVVDSALLTQYIKVPFELLYPILSIFNLTPLMMSITFFLVIQAGRRVVAAYMFLLDLFPAIR